MKSSELRLGRTFGVTFEDGSDFFSELEEFCLENKIKQGYIPYFLAGFSEVELVGTSDKLENPKAPVWSKVYLENVEVFGGGTIAYDIKQQKILPHIHVTTGIKPHGATAHTSHLLKAKVQFLVEMIFTEIISPNLIRVANKNLYDIPLLNFAL